MRPWRSVGAKLSLLTAAFTLAVIFTMARGLFKAAEDGLIAEMRVRVELFGRVAREALVPKVNAFQLHLHVSELLREKAVTSASIEDADGRILSHSDPKLIGETRTDPFSLEARRAPDWRVHRWPGPDGRQRYELSAPIVVGSARVGTARLGFDETSLEAALRGTKREIAWLAVLATLAAVVGTSLIVGWIIRPLPRLAAAAREIGRGNFGVRVDWRTGDEIGLLARAFNDMAIANSLMFAAMRQEKEKIETIFHETREGIVWTDVTGRILLINPAARQLLGCQDRAVDTLADASAGFKARPALAEIFAGRPRTTPLELERSESKLLILGGACDRLGDEKDPSGYLFVFHDATLEKRGETLARNFLSLVSHKLRTPLAVALGFLELIEGDSKYLNDFQRGSLKKVRDESEKLRHLVESLITFSTVQSPENIVLERVDVKPRELMLAALKRLETPLAKPGVRLDWDEDFWDDLPKLKGDSLLLREVLVNMIENAVKFNKADDKLVKVGAAQADGRLTITVADNGPGIPGEEKPKLFRRFYQIDEHFTGQIPGFGLGLAFVKNVVEAHGGQAGVRSEIGKGSEFWVSLPL